jgi:C1A family cysteine protease
MTLKTRMGWLPDLPSISDFTPGTRATTSKLAALGQPPVADILEKLGIVPSAEAGVRADLTGYFPVIEDQGYIGSCTAHTTIALAEYFQNRAFGRYTDLSRLFLYKATRNLLGWKGDTGAFMRTAMGALVLFGAPPEEFWQYDERGYDKEPPAWIYNLAQNFQATSYFRLDEPGLLKPDLVDRIRGFVANGVPSMIGFTAYESIGQAARDKGAIPYPANRERVVGGHAVVIVGYDDEKVIKNTFRRGGPETVGAFKIRNSWGPNWGDKGYGWMPYDYVLAGLADDIWSMIQMEWVETGQFAFEE